MYIVINGKINNFLFSLDDYLNRKSSLIRRFEDGIFIWGTSRLYSVEKPGTKVLLYLSRDEEKGFDGCIVLSGEIEETGELKEKYWPEGEWPYYIVIKVSVIPKSVLENKDPKRWKCVTREVLKEKFNFKPMPGIQKLDDKIGEEIEKILANIEKV
ncbi:hypothetical protein [Saccharolobus caldissimus]|uniref:EVE domain-containing protein n=1 Tax=Saccharolobus caldissimus TaxID=1702097 RepID=A0AAQ4CWV0_9CREN|nr:hypothetical protein [Saccharolobus caldissimus]BDC00282.1 hypothetical protein SACC_32980 [Saccharolobus caldissimus]